MGEARFKKLRDGARRLGAKALGELLASDQRAQTMGAALQGFQRARNRLDEQQLRLLGALGVATQADLERVSRKVGRLRKRLQDLLARFDDPI